MISVLLHIVEADWLRGEPARPAFPGLGPRCNFYCMATDFDTSDTADARRNLVDALYRKYSRALSRFLQRQRLKPDEVSDIVQETYCRLQQSGSVANIRNPRAFIFRIASNLRFNSRKARRSALEKDLLDIDSVELSSDEPGPYRSFKSQQDLAIVREAFEELPPKCREAFIMNRFEGMTFPQIAVELDVSVSMIEKHVAHAVAHLRRRLEDQQPVARRNVLPGLK